jgi:hypothetical protein
LFLQSGSFSYYFFSSTNIELTNTPGSAGSKWKPSKFYAYQPLKNDSANNATCDCPTTVGPTSETQTTSNISDSSQSCDCVYVNTFTLETIQTQSQITDNCECPELSDQSDQEMVNYETRNNGSGGKYDCSCSGPSRFTVQNGPTVEHFSDQTGSRKFDDNPNNDNNYQNSTLEDNVCSCPTQEGWTDEQLALLQETNKFSGGSTDCFCVPSSELSLGLHKKLQSLTTTRKSTPVDTVP